MVQISAIFGIGVISIAVAQLSRNDRPESHDQDHHWLGISNQPRISKPYHQVHGISPNKSPFVDRQGVIQNVLNNPTSLAIASLAVGGAVSLGLGLGDAFARRERLRTELNAKILDNCSDTQLVIRLIQEGINFVLDGLNTANSGRRALEDPALFRQADILQQLEGYRDALPVRACA